MDLLGELNAASMISKIASGRADVANAPDLIGSGVAAVPKCPTDGSDYVLKLKGKKLTITCGNIHSDTNTMKLKDVPP